MHMCSICNKKNEVHIIKEEFLQFGAAHDLSGAGIAKQILNTLQDNQLDLSHMVGQGYDGASAMSGNLNGVQAHVRKAAPTAVYVHCSSHSLNLVLNSCCYVSEIRNMFGIVKETINFINDSIKRREILERHLTEAGSTSLKLKTFCETRFIERHEALVLFQNNYAIIVSSLEEILQLAAKS